MNKIKKILWFTWKDRKHPLAGGAELVNEEIAKRFVKEGNEVIFITGGFPGGKSEEEVDGYKIIRLGNKWTVYWLAYKYYKQNLVGWADLVIDEVNTIPFFAKFYVKERNIILCYQLCREIWFYQLSFPLSLIGYLIEPIYLWLLRKQIVLTESESTKKDMQKYGYEKDKIHVFNVGLEIDPVKDLKTVSKYNKPTILCLGAIKGMKQTLHCVKAFEIAKEKIRNLKLIIAGDADSTYGRKVLDYIDSSKYKDSISYFGKVS
ncbi:MAG: glycosyltransferase, partial [Candidatus Woesebacteria bacterium]|nr:glycosyltransferase [Candidatus Woesebacteria bacterium]